MCREKAEARKRIGRPRLSPAPSALLSSPAAMPRRLLLALVPCLLLAACADGDDGDDLDATPPPSVEPGTAPVAGPDAIPNPVTTRGLYLGVVFDSAAAVISHEEIPGFMGAMRMQLRVADRSELRGLREGDKIRFRLSDPAGNGYEVSEIEKLPPDTPLELADYGADGVPPEASIPLPDSSGS